MKILIDARILSGLSGGVEQAVVGLADAFRLSENLGLNFHWLMYEGHTDWLASHLPKDSEVIETPHAISRFASKKRIIELVRNSPTASKPLAYLRAHGPLAYKLSDEPLVVSKLNPDVIHFPTQFGFSTRRPNVYQPHDLQHKHFPKFFTRENLAIRDIAFAKMLTQASRIVVGNEWTKGDFIQHYPHLTHKIDNVPVFPQIFPAIANRDSLPIELNARNYILYPAAGWAHKNHLRLLEAFAQVLSNGLNLDLVLTGALIEDNPLIQKKIEELGLRPYVHIQGFVSPDLLASIYQGASMVVVPTLFESASFPIWEAFNLGIPVVAARTTAIPAQVDDAAILFDPSSVSEMAAAIMAALNEQGATVVRVKKGISRVRSFTGPNTALGFRFNYRQAANLPKDALDTKWLSEGMRF